MRKATVEIEIILPVETWEAIEEIRVQRTLELGRYVTTDDIINKAVERYREAGTA